MLLCHIVIILKRLLCLLKIKNATEYIVISPKNLIKVPCWSFVKPLKFLSGCNKVSFKGKLYFKNLFFSQHQRGCRWGQNWTAGKRISYWCYLPQSPENYKTSNRGNHFWKKKVLSWYSFAEKGCFITAKEQHLPHPCLELSDCRSLLV